MLVILTACEKKSKIKLVTYNGSSMTTCIDYINVEETKKDKIYDISFSDKCIYSDIEGGISLYLVK